VSGNIHYKTQALERYFSSNRVRWEQFYPSERELIARVWPNSNPAILDIGCGCGGLGLALNERFGATRYTGIEIHPEAAGKAIQLNSNARILNGDFLDIYSRGGFDAAFDMTISLSCIDWNTTFDAMLCSAWATVKPGGMFIASFRLCAGEGVNDIRRSYQYINYDGIREGEIAAYVVLNAGELASRLKSLGAAGLVAFGYYGRPGVTAVTAYTELCFVALAAHKPPFSGSELELDLPDSIAEILRRGWLDNPIAVNT
jgi:SAM-dependent methyltransferase